ncbi:hypothetical protein [Clostridium sp.]|uniref:hypothetical protein n=1 Tax=Clostridium sp. TaxID=1506 RepID=UPI0026175EAF|nr:hypothetical protein [Clostridium sp.]
MKIYNIQYYIDDIKRLIIENKMAFLERNYREKLNSMSMVELEKELKEVTGKAYCKLTGNNIGFQSLRNRAYFYAQNYLKGGDETESLLRFKN